MEKWQLRLATFFCARKTIARGSSLPMDGEKTSGATRSPLEGRKFVVDESSAIRFHEAAFRQLAESLRPSEPVSSSADALIVQTVGSDGRVSTRTLNRSATDRPFLDASVDETLYVLGDGDDAPEDRVVALRGVSSWDDLTRRAHATRWSSGKPVVWCLHARSLFCPRVALSIRVNHDFNLYDLPAGHPAVMTVRDGKCRVLECEAFTCKAVAQRTRNRRFRDADGNVSDSRFDMVSLWPPSPTRPLRRPTDLSFDATEDTVDVRTAKRFVRVLFGEYASRDQGVASSWTDPLGAGRGEWNETTGRLLWKLMTLDEDELHAMHDGSVRRVVDAGVDHVAKLVTTLLMAPWFLTANFLDVVLGRSVPFGALNIGEFSDDVDHWDASPARWKSRLCLRAFHDELSRPTYECDERCDKTVKAIVRDAHHGHDGPKPSSDDIVLSESRVYRCVTCLATERETDRNDVKVGADIVRPEITCRRCGIADNLKYERLVKQARCGRKNCGCGNRWMDCDCCENEKLAQKQWKESQRAYWSTMDDLERVEKRVVNAKNKKILLRPKRKDEDKEAYRALTKDAVDSVAVRYEACTSLLCLTCETAAAPPPDEEDYVFQADDLEWEEPREESESTLETRKLVEDAHDAMTPNAEWRVVRCVRDALLLSFVGGSEVPKKKCDHCFYGTCEWWTEDGKFHCVMCKRGKQEREEEGTEEIVMDIDQNAFGYCDSYSHDGNPVTRRAFYQIVMREMLKPYY